MKVMPQVFSSRAAIRLLFAASAAALMAGCSDASRFGSDPFSDPFGGARETQARAPHTVDRHPTGSIAPGARVTAVQSQPLAPPSATASAKPVPTPAAPTKPGSFNHWTAEGGTPVTLAEGETPAIIANRYGVPTDVLLKVNGFAPNSLAPAGSRLIIPVYHANAPKSAAVEPEAHKEVHAEAKPAPKPEPREESKPAHVAEKPAPAKHVAAKARRRKRRSPRRNPPPNSPPSPRRCRRKREKRRRSSRLRRRPRRKSPRSSARKSPRRSPLQRPPRLRKSRRKSSPRPNP